MSDRLDDRGRTGLLDDYVAIAARRGQAIEATALRTESIGLREVLAHGATRGERTLDDLRSAVLGGDDDVTLDPLFAARLARVCALQNFFDTDRPFAREILRMVASRLGSKPNTVRFRRLFVELLVAARAFEDAREVLENDAALRVADHDYLAVDLQNPFLDSPFADREAWLYGFNRTFAANNLEPVAVGQGPGAAFDRLESHVPAATARGPLISVVMTTFSAQREAILASARSILNQTWSDLELIVVDDASAEEFAPALDEVAVLDSRVRVVRLTHNGGTYLARNAGIDAARGMFVTGQDSDDWSHPRRLELQVQPLLDDPDLPGTRSSAVFVSESLVRTRVGYSPRAVNASSLMVRRADVLALGGYMAARRAADNELHRRLERSKGRAVLDMHAPLAIIRLGDDSLSRGDFRAGWKHPARKAFSDTYSFWHASTPTEHLSITGRTPPVPVPTRFAVTPRAPATYDVVFASDWRAYGGPQKSMLEEIRALTERGWRVGVMHLEAPRFMSVKDNPLCAQVQRLINHRVVGQVLPDDVATVRLLILRYPPILQFAQPRPSTLNVERLVILANQAPSERDGADIRYLPEDCSRNAEAWFGVRGLWVPQGPTVRGALRGHLPPEDVAPYDMPGILEVDEWYVARRRLRADRPVVGRHSRDNVMKWPETKDVLSAVYPTDGEFDVRVMGGGKVPLSVLGVSTAPPAWVVFEKDEMPVRTFLSSLDFFVYYQNSNAYDAFGRAILEAAANGCVVVLPHHFEETFGGAALYAEPKEAANVVRELYAHPSAYRARSTEAVEHVRKTFSHESYAARIESILGARAGAA